MLLVVSGIIIIVTTVVFFKKVDELSMIEDFKALVLPCFGTSDIRLVRKITTKDALEKTREKVNSSRSKF